MQCATLALLRGPALKRSGLPALICISFLFWPTAVGTWSKVLCSEAFRMGETSAKRTADSTATEGGPPARVGRVRGKLVAVAYMKCRSYVFSATRVAGAHHTETAPSKQTHTRTWPADAAYVHTAHNYIHKRNHCSACPYETGTRQTKRIGGSEVGSTENTVQ